LKRIVGELSGEDRIDEWTNLFFALDQNPQCKHSKDVLVGEKFLFCIYLRDNLDMLTLSQVIGAVLIVVLPTVAMPAVTKFEWEGNANLAGMFHGPRWENLNRAKVKRKA
jgi:hypothetical protein